MTRTYLPILLAITLFGSIALPPSQAQVQEEGIFIQFNPPSAPGQRMDFDHIASLRFTEAPLHKVILAMLKHRPGNYVFDHSIPSDSVITARMEDVPWEKALRTILETTEYEFRSSTPTLYVIAPRADFAVKQPTNPTLGRFTGADSSTVNRTTPHQPQSSHSDIDSSRWNKNPASVVIPYQNYINAQVIDILRSLDTESNASVGKPLHISVPIQYLADLMYTTISTNLIDHTISETLSCMSDLSHLHFKMRDSTIVVIRNENKPLPTPHVH